MTDVDMPPVTSTVSGDVDDNDVAFKVLNKDNLPMTVVGESMLKPFGRDSQKQKPNIIVYPTRRITNNLEENKQRPFARSNGHINSFEDNELGGKALSASHGNLNHTNSAKKSKQDDHNQKNFDTKFTKTLDAKLKKLQKESKSNKNDASKKPFVTTVKKGLFLQPPPEVANLLGIKIEEEQAQKKIEKKLYAYTSQPRVLNSTNKQGHKARCEAAAKAAASIAGSAVGLQMKEDITKDINSNISRKIMDAPLPYANLMFDRRVVRGSNYAQMPMQTQKWNPNFANAKSLSKEPVSRSAKKIAGEGESAAARAAEARRRAMARRKAQNQQVRGAQLRLGSPPPVAGRRHEPVQTELYLEELWNNPPVQDMCTQTDLFLDRPVSPYYVPAKTGEDVETQIYPGDLFDFDMEVQPILEVLVGKTIEQSLIEVLEEEELAALREQQRRFLELRAADTAEAQRLEERERRLRCEKDRRMKEHEEGLRLQNEMEERIAAAVLMQGYMADLLPSVLEGLENEGFLVDNIKEDISEAFLPWLMKEVTHELQEMVSSRDILTDMVREILENRAEIYKALNRTPRSEAGAGEEEEEGGGGDIILQNDDRDLREHLELKEAIRALSRENALSPY